MSADRRVLVVAADGADPNIIARMIAEHKLPHLARLCGDGIWGPLETTFPPVSPVAWMTCLSGVSPAEHGIRDFITKAEDSYLPTVGLFNVGVGKDGIPIYTSRRRASTLPELLSDAGRSAYLLKVPGTFPPPPVRGGVLAGFGMPDLLGTFGVSAWYTTDPDGKKADAPEGVELIHGLTPLGTGVWRGQIAGPVGTTLEYVLRRDRNQATLGFGSEAERPAAILSVGEWSGWIRVAFDVAGRGPVPGMCRFKLISLGQVVQLYCTPVQCASDAPLFQLSEPAGYGARLESLVGPYATLGMPSDMDGVRRGVVDLDTFLEDAYANWEQQVTMTQRLMDDSSWDLLMTHLFTVDNIQHLFWHCQDPRHPAYRVDLERRYGDEIERAYRWIDEKIGHMADGLGPETVLMVISDHGGLPVYQLVYVNAWLQSQGYLAPREVAPEGTAARVDWSRTRAVMFGTGGIWLNVQGREPRGTVQPGAPYEALRQELAQALSSWTDPEMGQRVIKEVLLGERVFGARARERGPDLVVALQPGYGLGRGEGLGRVMSGTPFVVANRSAWTGGHEGPYLPSDVPGVYLIANLGWESQGVNRAALQDIAPTVLHLLGLERSPGMVGRPLL